MRLLPWGIGFSLAIAVSSASSLAADSAGPELSAPRFLLEAADAARAGDGESAVQLFQSAIIYAPTDPMGYEKLAEFYAHSGQPALAQQYFALALDAQPAYPPALQGLALLQLSQGNRAGAQAQRDILLRACGATCPETTQVEKALNSPAKP